MLAMTTAELIAKLQKQDPEGKRLVYFCVYDEDSDEMIASADPSQCVVTIKNGRQTGIGERDILEINVWLDCG